MLHSMVKKIKENYFLLFHPHFLFLIFFSCLKLVFKEVGGQEATIKINKNKTMDLKIYSIYILIISTAHQPGVSTRSVWCMSFSMLALTLIYLELAVDIQ